jgi:transcriptional regulator with XRE-family HTH domain
MAEQEPSELALLADLGQRLAQARLDRNQTQEELAQSAAVSKRTVERLETGASVQLSNLVRVLKALGLASNLEQLAPPPGPRPMEQLKLHGKSRQRASTPKEGTSAWTWGDKS